MRKVTIDFGKFIDILGDYFSVDLILEIMDNMNDNDVFLEDVIEDWFMECFECLFFNSDIERCMNVDECIYDDDVDAVHKDSSNVITSLLSLILRGIDI